MSTTYQKFHNPPSFAGENGPAAVDPPTYPFQMPPTSVVAGQAPYVQQPRKELKSLPTLRRLVRVELTLALAMLFLDVIVEAVIASSHIYGPATGICALGTGIWVGALGVITAGLGFGAFKTQYGNKCLIVANFVMCIICTVADGIMIIFASICLAHIPWALRGSYVYNSHTRMGEFQPPSAETAAMIRGVMSAEVMILLAAIAHFVASIVSTAFICRNWCQDSQPAVAVVYFPGTAASAGQSTIGNGASDAADPCRIAVPSGAHVQQYVIFVPLGNGANQAVFAPGTMVQPQPPQPDFRDVQAIGDEKRV